MIEIIVEEIINYITNEVMTERYHRGHLIKWLKEYLDKESEYDNETLRKIRLEKCLNWVDEIKRIRDIYQKGKPFVYNLKKGNKKGLNFHHWLYFIKTKVDRNEIEKATEDAKAHLEWIKKQYSERTYYRHKKKIRELGIEV